MIADGLSPGVADFICFNKAAKRAQRGYRSYQAQFQQWLEDGSFEPGINPAIPIVNWLHYIQAARNLKWSTLMTMKTAVLSLVRDPDAVRRDPYYREFLKAGKSESVVESKSTEYDISPVLQYFQGLPHNQHLTMEVLTSKLCWLLGVCGFMRPDDIRCVDVSLSQVFRGKLQLVVVFPKERAGGQRIIKHVNISPHTDPKLCPVSAYTAYIARLSDISLRFPHPKDPDRDMVPLIRFVNDESAVARPATISGHMYKISQKMALPDAKAPKLRALGSTLAALAGVPIPDIMVQGNWSSPKVFEKHYRLSSATANNISVSALGMIPLESHTDMAP